MIGPVMAADLLPGDVVIENDWRLTISAAYQGEWVDQAGVRHFGEIVITRQLGPGYPQHFALAQPVLVDRAL